MCRQNTVVWALITDFAVDYIFKHSRVLQVCLTNDVEIKFNENGRNIMANKHAKLSGCG